MDNFENALKRLINEFSVENESDTPDFILAEYIRDALNAYNAATYRRDAWHGFKRADTNDDEEQTP